MKYEIIEVGGYLQVVPTDNPDGKSWVEIKKSMVELYEDYVAYWRNKDEPKYYGYDPGRGHGN